MANIPVERSGGMPWWAWLLGLLALLLVGALLLSQCNDDDAVVIVDPTEDVSTAGVVTDLDLSDVYVTRVVGDNAFFVSPTEGGTDETLVYLEEEATPGTETEGRYDVTPGQHLSITGAMESTPADLTPWGLTAEQAEMVGPQYVRATSLTVLDGASDATGAATGAAVTSLAGLTALLRDASGGSLDGREVRLAGLRVTSVVGDSTFYVGNGDERMPVVLEELDESERGAGGTDGVFDVNEGDTVSINGRVQSFRAGMAGTGGLSATDRTALDTRPYLIVVRPGDMTKQ